MNIRGNVSKGVVFTIIIILIIGFVGGFGYFYYNKYISKEIQNTSNTTGNSASVNSNPVIVTKDNLPKYLEGQSFINSLPKDAVITLRLYNFESGEREWEESYVIKKGSVKEISDSEINSQNEDISIIIHSKYLNDLKNGFCNTIKAANTNRDLGVELKISEFALAWKYKSVLSQKSCLGL